MQGGSGLGWLLENWVLITTFGILAWLMWVYIMMTKRKAPPRQIFEQVTSRRHSDATLGNPTLARASAGPVVTLPTVDHGPRMVNPDEVILLPPPAHMVPFMLKQRQCNPVLLSNELVMSFVVRRDPEQIRLFLGEFCLLSASGNALVAYRQAIREPQKAMRRILHRVELICQLHHAVLSKCKSTQRLQEMMSNVDLFCTFVAIHDMGTELEEVASKLKQAVRRMSRTFFKLSNEALRCIAAEKSPLGRLMYLLSISEKYATEDERNAQQSTKPPKETIHQQKTKARFEQQRLEPKKSPEEVLSIEPTSTVGGASSQVVNTPTATLQPIDQIPQVGAYVQITNHTSGNFVVEVRVDWREVYKSTSHGRKIALDPALRNFYEQAMKNGYYPSTDTGTSGTKKEPNVYVVKISYPDAQNSPLNVDNVVSLIARKTDSGGPQGTLRLTFVSAEKRH
jgi:hypothetical protein